MSLLSALGIGVRHASPLDAQAIGASLEFSREENTGERCAEWEEGISGDPRSPYAAPTLPPPHPGNLLFSFSHLGPVSPAVEPNINTATEHLLVLSGILPSTVCL